MTVGIRPRPPGHNSDSDNGKAADVEGGGEMVGLERTIKAEDVNFLNIRKRSDTQYDLQIGLLRPLSSQLLASYKTLPEARDAMNVYFDALQRGESIKIWRIE